MNCRPFGGYFIAGEKSPLHSVESRCVTHLESIGPRNGAFIPMGGPQAHANPQPPKSGQGDSYKSFAPGRPAGPEREGRGLAAEAKKTWARMKRFKMELHNSPRGTNVVNLKTKTRLADTRDLPRK